MSNAANTPALQLETRRLEETLRENAEGRPQKLEYNPAEGNISLAPRNGNNDSFGVLCRNVMTQNFGGWGTKRAGTDVRTLERALRDNTNGHPQVFEYNTEDGNMALVPADTDRRTAPGFGNVCREAMTRDFGAEEMEQDGESGHGAHGGGALCPNHPNPFPSAGNTQGFGIEAGNADIAVAPAERGGKVAVLEGDDLCPPGTTQTLDGTAYTLEDEGVVRILRGRSDAYAKGKRNAAVFVWGDGGEPCARQDVRYIVRVSGGDEVSVTESISGRECRIPEVMVVPRTSEMYRLGSGLLESPLLKDRRALLIGCGSMGGDIAMHLAMAGVGNICLADPDRVAPSNLSRLREGSVADVGRRKVDMFAERIRGKNPRCQIQTVARDITKDPVILSRFLAATDVVVVSTDNRTSRVLVARGLQAAGKTCIYTRCATRVECGDCFVARPGQACYECLYGMMDGVEEDIDDWVAAKKAGRLAAYCTPEDMADFAILPGISTDISAITSFAARLAIWELANGGNGNPYRLFCEEFSRFNYFLYVNRREKYFRNEAWAPFDKSGQRPCPQRWYGAAIARREDCSCCGTRSGEIDTGDADTYWYADIAAKDNQNGN